MSAKRLVVGRPLRSTLLGETLLPKRLALPVFCSDPLSSNAYATEEILLVLSIGGLALLHLAPFVALGVMVLLLVVVSSYRQTCRAYPSGGGAYAVSRANLGQRAALVAAAALLVDYVLTVAVSVASGVANLVSAVPELGRFTVPLCVGIVVLLTVMNLRGVRESGTVFAIPTYGFVVAVGVMLLVGGYRALFGDGLAAPSASIQVAPTNDHLAGFVLVAVVLRAFASGCTALTGVEAVSNGVPSFKPPKSRNAAATLTIMAVLTVTMFAGITMLALAAHVHMAEHPDQLIGAPDGYHQMTVIAQLASATFGTGSIGFYLVQGFTTLILALAANTAFNGFPILASILAHDGYAPRQMARRGDRLVFSNGVIALSGVAIALLVMFRANPTRLIQLYILGVFVSFTLSQAGMVRHWTQALATAPKQQRGSILRSRVVNAAGAVLTSVVLVVVLATKFTHGAWLVVLAMPLVYAVMQAVHRHYTRVEHELVPPVSGVALPSRVHAVVLVSRLTTAALQAVAFARATRPSTLVALTVRTDPAETDRLVEQWAARRLPVPLTALDSPYRDITRPILEYISSVRRSSPRDVVCVYVPEYVVQHGWEALLHNQSALRLKARLLFMPGVMVTSVPWRFGVSRPVDDEAWSRWSGAAGPEPGAAPGRPQPGDAAVTPQPAGGPGAPQLAGVPR